MTRPLSVGPKVEMIRSPILRGQSQFLGGAVGGRPGEEKIYCIPGHASRVLVIDPRDDSCREIGPSFEGQFKWLRGVSVPSNGIIYGLPCHHTHVLRIDPFNDEVSLLPIPVDVVPLEATYQASSNNSNATPWKFHGGALSPIDNCIYSIPQFSERVLKIDPSTDTVSFIGQRLIGRYKFYGGVVGCDGAIYGIPQNASSVLRIDPLCRSTPNEVVTLHGNLGDGGYKWHGGSAVHKGNVIIGIPCHSNHVLKIEPGFPEPIITLEGDNSVIKSGRHQPENRYKFLGAVTDLEGSSIYCIPSGAERVLKVKLLENVGSFDGEMNSRYIARIYEVGPNLREEGLEKYFQV